MKKVFMTIVVLLVGLNLFATSREDVTVTYNKSTKVVHVAWEIPSGQAFFNEADTDGKHHFSMRKVMTSNNSPTVLCEGGEVVDTSVVFNAQNKTIEADISVDLKKEVEINFLLNDYYGLVWGSSYAFKKEDKYTYRFQIDKDGKVIPKGNWISQGSKGIFRE